MLQVPQVDFENSSLRSKGLWIAITLALWLGTTWVFWVGYAGCDDLFYGAMRSGSTGRRSVGGSSASR